jgi:anti-sigma factor RsiW
MRKHDHDGDCRALLTRMAQGVEGDLSAAERRALARHLAGCRKCGEFSESLKRTIRLCQQAGAPAMSARTQARARGNILRLLSQTITKPARGPKAPKATKATKATKKKSTKAVL